MSFDHIADMFTRIRNAQLIGKTDVSMPSSKFKLALAKVLYENGYIDDASIFSEGKKSYLRIKLRYMNGKPAIKGICQISRQGQRVYVDKTDSPYVKNNLGMAVVSTSRGVMTDSQAREVQIGGELICKVW